MQVFVVAKLFVENAKGELLVIRRSQTAPRRPLEWDLPGGWVELDEAPNEAAIRELCEETGIITKRITSLCTATEERDDETITRHYFIAKTEHDQVVLSFEHDAFEWVSRDNFVDYMRYQPHLDAFEKLQYK